MPHNQDHPPQERPSIGVSFEQELRDYDRRRLAESLEASEPDDGGPEGGPLISTLRGVGRAVNEVNNLSQSLLKKGVKLSGLHGLVEQHAPESEGKEEWLAAFDENYDLLDISEDRPGGVWGFYEGAVQFAAPFVATMGALGGVQATGLGTTLVRSGVSADKVRRGLQFARISTAGAVVDFSAFDPFEGNLSNLYNQWTPDFMPDSPLSVEEGDGEFEGRFKMALEGFFLGTTIDLLWGGFRALRARQAVREGTLSPQEGARVINDGMAQAEAAAREQARTAREGAVDDPTTLREPTEAVQEAAQEQRGGVRRRLAEAIDPSLRGAQEAAILDDLTGLRNKNALGRAKARIDEDPLTEWVFIDLRDFKALNDNLGHEAGDTFLREAGAALRATGLDERSIFRAGGDEFALAVPKGQGETAARMAREAIGEMPVPDTEFVVRARSGVGDTLDEADQAMLGAKAQETGPRNRNVTASGDQMELNLRTPREEPFGVRDNEDGTATLRVDTAARDNLGDDFPEEIHFNSREEAEKAAASFNMVSRFRSVEPGPVPTGARERTHFQAVVDRMQAGATPGEAVKILRGTDLNYSLVSASGDSRISMEALSEVYREAMDNARTHPTQAEIVQAANNMVPDTSAQEVMGQLGITTENLLDSMPTLLAARTMLWGRTQRITQLSKSLVLDPSNTIVQRQMAEEFDELANLALQVVGTKSAYGRALKSLDLPVEEGAQKRLIDEADEAAEALTKTEKPGFVQKWREADLTSSETQSIARTLDVADGDPEAMLRAFKLLTKRLGNPRERTFWDHIISFRAAMMLSGVRTWAVNLSSSLWAMHQVPAEMALGGLVTGNREKMKEGLEMLASPYADNGHILREALTMFKRSFRENRSILDPKMTKDEQVIAQSFDWHPDHNPFRNAFGSLIGIGGRVLISTDEFVKRAAYLSHVRANSLKKARAEARELGIQYTPDQLSNRVYDDMARSVGDDGQAQIFGKALKHSREVTWTDRQDPGTAWDRAQKLVNSSRLARFVMPFVNTPINIFKFSYRRFPVLGAFQRENFDLLKAARQGDRDAAATIAGRQLGGLLFYGMAMELAFGERITGKGPANSRLRQQMVESGWQPYSVKIPGEGYISFRRFEPIATPLALAADYATFMGEMNEETAEEAGIALATSFAASVSNKSFLMGLTQFFEAVGSGEEFKMDRFLTAGVTSFTPALMRQANPDPVWREADTFLESIMATVPGWSEDLEPRRNIFGEPVMKTSRQLIDPLTGYINESFNPFTVISGGGVDQTQLDLAKLGKAMTMPAETKQQGEIDLRDREKWSDTGQSPYDRWMEIMAENGVREDVESLMASSRYQNAPAGDEHLEPGGIKHRLVSGKLEEHKGRAWGQILREYPKLKEALPMTEKQRVEALLSN